MGIKLNGTESYPLVQPVGSQILKTVLAGDENKNERDVTDDLH